MCDRFREGRPFCSPPPPPQVAPQRPIMNSVNTSMTEVHIMWEVVYCFALQINDNEGVK